MSTLLKSICAAFVFLVLISPRCTGEDLIIAGPEQARYTLSNVRYETDNFGRSVVAVDFRRTKKGEGSVFLAGKTEKQDLSLSGVYVNANESSGKLAFRFMGFSNSKNLELYLAARGPGGMKYLVSNAVRLGNPGPASRARPLNAEDKEKIAKAIQFKTPPENLPENFVALTDATSLLPGMPLKAGYYGDWKDAELISIKSDGKLAVKYEGENKLTVKPREKWLAISPDVIAKGKSSPGQFSASVAVLPGGSQIIPPGAQPLPDDIKLLPGTPLLEDYHDHKWHKVYFMSESFGKIKIRYDGYSSSWDKSLPRDKFLIEDSVQKKLADPEIAAKFEKNLMGKGSSSDVFGRNRRAGGRRSSIRSRPIKISLPPKTQVVPDDLTIPPGTPLAACWARKWNEITALEENEDGSIFVRWEGYGSEYDMIREELIIEDKTVKKLKAAAKKASGNTEEELRKTLRTWTDASGGHKIEAKYVSRTEKEVTIQTGAGREIVLPIDKLSAEDQELLSGIKAKVPNPFE